MSNVQEIVDAVQVDVPSRNGLCVMPLHSAVAAQNLLISQALLEHGAPVNAPQQEGYMPLHEAAQSGQLEMIGCCWLTAPMRRHIRPMVRRLPRRR